MSTRFAITRVRLRQYRSIAACDVELGPLTLLVGPNGSGKSNFLDALRLTSQSLSENLDNALRERGGINEVRRRSRGHPNNFGVDLRFATSTSFGFYKYQIGAVKGGEFRVTHEECRLEPTSFGGAPVYFSVRDGTLVASSEAVLPPVARDRLFLVAAAGLKPFREVFDGLSAINVYSLSPDAIRQLQKPEAGELLKRDGSNLASVVERLRRDRPETKMRIEEYLSRVVQGVTAVDRRGYGSWETLEFKQRVAGDEAPWTFQANSMSDGTLRALGVLVALFAGTPEIDAPLGIEEPEVALHPAAAGVLLDALRDASDRRQVLVTTHSPDVLDSASISADELVAVRADEGVTVLNHIDHGGQIALKEALFTAGELLRVDQLTPDPNIPVQLELFS